MKIFIRWILAFGIILVSNISYAEAILSGTGIITYPQEEERKSVILYEKYPFKVNTASNINLHFISKVEDYIEIRVINSDSENEIKAFNRRIRRDQSPFDETVHMAAGNYCLIVYKVKSSNSTHNTGQFSFLITANKIEPVSSVPVKVPEEKKITNVVQNNVENLKAGALAVKEPSVGKLITEVPSSSGNKESNFSNSTFIFAAFIVFYFLFIKRQDKLSFITTILQFIKFLKELF